MAKLTSSKCLFFLFSSLLFLRSSGTQVGFAYDAGGSIAASSVSRTVSFLRQNEVSASHIRVFVTDHSVLSTLSNSNVTVDLYLDQSIIKNLTNAKSSAMLWLNTHVMSVLPHVSIKSIVVRGRNDLSKVLPTLKLIQSLLRTSSFDNDVKVTVAFSLSFLENLNGKQAHDLHRVLGFIKSIRSFVIVESSTDHDIELNMGDLFLNSLIKKATLATSILSCNDVDIVMTIKTLVDPSAKQVAEFAAMSSKSLKNNRIPGQITELYIQVSSIEGFAEKEMKREHEQIFPSARRELKKSSNIVSHDGFNPPVTLPQDNPAPTIVTVPATNPGTVTPANPASTPVQIPSTTPVLFPPTSPAVNPLAPVTNPVTTPATPITVPGMQPITNPVTTYPAPPGNVPVTTPATNPVTPPATTNAPAIPGQSWCVAKNGVSETALQTALDYACGMGGADCSPILQGGSCYNPNTLQNHASYAFNSYYQKNPVGTSCDFGGTASIVSSNPSTGSCVFPSSSSSSSSPPSTTSSVPTPSTPITNPATTPSIPGAGETGTGTPPSVLNSSSPGSGTTTVFGSDTPPGFNSSTSKSAALHPSIGCIILVALFVARTITLVM